MPSQPPQPPSASSEPPWEENQSNSGDASPPELDLAQTFDFLTHWAPAPNTWTLVAIEATENDNQRPHIHAKVFEAIPVPPDLSDSDWWTTHPAAEWLSAYAARNFNLYFTVNATVPGLRTSPTKNQITSIRGLHVDIDLPKPPAAGHEPTAQNYALLLNRLERVQPQPTVALFSGGGYQALWQCPEQEANADNIARTEALNKQLEQALGADHCHNINRLFRLPGTVNTLNAKKRVRGRRPALAHVVYANWAQTLAPGAGAPVVMAADPNAPPAPTVARRAAVRERQLASPPPLPEDGGGGGASEPRLGDLPQRLQHLITTGDAAPWQGDRSRLLWYVITHLIRLGWTDEAILPFMTETTYGLSSHVLTQSHPSQYAARQLTRAREAVRSDWQRGKGGEILAHSRHNAVKALDELGAHFSFDTFAMRAWVNGYGRLRQVDDDAVINLRMTIDERFEVLPEKNLFIEVVRHLCRQGDFHPVRRYLDDLIWDGVRRLGTMPSNWEDIVTNSINGDTPLDPGQPSWLTTYGGAEDSLYTRAVGRLTLLAAVRRVRQPGCKFDEMLVLINPTQGTNKSSALRIIAREEEWFRDHLPLGEVAENGKRAIELLSGKWIIEASELSGLNKSDVEGLKGFLSRQFDEDRLAYDRYRTELPRQSVIIGTTNAEVFLKDDQNRRFWPIWVQVFNLEALERDADQLWAEAAFYESQGESIRLAPALWPAAAEQQARAAHTEPWAEELDSALKDLNGRIANYDVWRILGKPVSNRTMEDNRRLATAMREIGFVRTRAKVGGHTKIVYERARTEADRALVIYAFRDDITGRVEVGHTPPSIFEDSGTEAPL